MDNKKKLKTKAKITFLLEKSIWESLKEYAKKHKISKNKAIQEAINLLTRHEA